MGGGGKHLSGALPSPPRLFPSSCHLPEERPQCLSVRSPGGDTEVQREARGALSPHGAGQAPDYESLRAAPVV